MTADEMFCCFRHPRMSLTAERMLTDAGRNKAGAGNRSG
jgi:hypothetical protein